jgi:RNA polymerase sigma-70 factor (ECF subfamily)
MVSPDTQFFAKAAPELAKRIRRGDHSAFKLLYRMEYLNLVHFVHGYLHDPEKSRDIAQDTMLALWENHSIINPSRNLRALVFTIARNKTLNELRHLKLFTPTAEEYDRALELLQDNSVEEYINALDLSALMEKVWDSLPENISRTFTKSRIDGLKNKEIALLEGVSEKAVEYRIGMALKRFRRAFAKLV